jgi:hypothetical protein
LHPRQTALAIVLRQSLATLAYVARVRCRPVAQSFMPRLGEGSARLEQASDAILVTKR